MTAAVSCLGSRYRGDDAAGLLVADRLLAAGVDVLDCGEDPSRLVERFEGLELVVVVDAVRSGAPPGTLHRVVLDQRAQLPRGMALASTHAFSIADALALAQALGRGPRRAVVHGIEGAAFALGDPLSPAVESRLDELAGLVVDELRAASAG